ncbi:Aspartate beta-hydroxylase domain-containing protein 2 [Hondaea fermentalgiana]|uniref:Aspartate beta-hydroxylase domain-containing protein 2 n=1 Tax=Hondaea fermentalgiana TaxID=2315210 RepID=A0A2R5GA81_9STRA|nr:Aspartate beta-hydroxylase domain-containing protein 2 [Hondaea fermentalgiana]|eukprot:GBG27930.1 Aspartate beta-hydroxylase domain-containing protein 2 [Hondaea fermentalgiana]
MQGKPVFQPYRAPTWANPARQAPDGIGSLGHTSGDWDVCYLFLHNVDFKDNLALFPETASLIKSIPGWYKHAFFSVLAPDTHIAQHHGPTNKKLRVHLPLVVPPGECSGIRVGPEKRIFERGNCLVFDDSFEHEAWNAHPSQARICLILDIWHPDLSEQEVNLLRFLEKAKMHRAKRLCAAHQASSVDAEQASGGEDENNVGNNGDAGCTVPVLPENENFYALLERTKAMRKSANLSVP